MVDFPCDQRQERVGPGKTRKWRNLEDRYSLRRFPWPFVDIPVPVNVNEP